MRIRKIGILGGSGFVGRHLVAILARRGYATRVLTRRRSRARHLLVVPSCELVQANPLVADELAARLAGCDAVVNLVGILNEDRANPFQALHAELPAKVAAAARANGIRRVLHMSAAAATPDAPSAYLRTKALGEEAAHAAGADGLAVTSFRPSVIFGPEDSFFNRFAAFLALSPLVFWLACPDARFAPAYVGDVARAFADALERESTFGERYDLCGPRRYTLRELVEYTARVTGRHRLVIGLGDGLSRLQARVLELVPGKPFSFDNYLSTRVESVCAEDGFARLGIAPVSVEAVVPTYLGGGGRTGLLTRLRSTAGRA